MGAVKRKQTKDSAGGVIDVIQLLMVTKMA